MLSGAAKTSPEGKTHGCQFSPAAPMGFSESVSPICAAWSAQQMEAYDAFGEGCLELGPTMLHFRLPLLFSPLTDSPSLSP